MSPEPTDPMTELAQMAASLHELFTSYVEAGFTEQQALYLIGKLITAGLQPPEQ